MSWRTGIGIVLLIAAIISGWSAWRLNRSDEVLNDHVDQTVDLVIWNFEMIALDETGTENLALQAPHMQRQRASQAFDIEAPVFFIPDDQRRYWQLRAVSGWISPKGEELRLRGDVEGDSPENSDVTPTAFRTATLTIQPRENLAFTNDLVTLSQPGITQTGVGFEAQLKQREFRLLSHVKVNYEPSDSP